MLGRNLGVPLHHRQVGHRERLVSASDIPDTRVVLPCQAEVAQSPGEVAPEAFQRAYPHWITETPGLALTLFQKACSTLKLSDPDVDPDQKDPAHPPNGIRQMGRVTSRLLGIVDPGLVVSTPSIRVAQLQIDRSNLQSVASLREHRQRFLPLRNGAEKMPILL